MSGEGNDLCRVCGDPLEYSGSGRRPLYCSGRCKKTAERKRRRFDPFRPFRRHISSPISTPDGGSQSLTPPIEPEPELTEAEKEVILGRPLFSGTWEEYRSSVLDRGFAPGGFLR